MKWFNVFVIAIIGRILTKFLVKLLEENGARAALLLGAEIALSLIIVVFVFYYLFRRSEKR
jgi:hypothetical protein